MIKCAPTTRYNILSYRRMVVGAFRRSDERICAHRIGHRMERVESLASTKRTDHLSRFRREILFYRLEAGELLKPREIKSSGPALVCGNSIPSAEAINKLRRFFLNDFNGR